MESIDTPPDAAARAGARGASRPSARRSTGEIRDTELDYRTGKLSEEDYAAIDGTLRAEALEILDWLDALEGAEI